MAAQREATGTRLRAIREELAGVTHLLSRGFATRTRQWELQRAEAEALGNLGQYRARRRGAASRSRRRNGRCRTSA
jgi:hypothetical protein